MGHHISKQQHQQTSDDHQRMSSRKTHIEPSTSVTYKQSKLNNTTATASQKAKKSKKNSRNQNKNGKLLKKSIDSLAKKPECSAGSVVITIRLLKMDSTKDFETINMNALQSNSLIDADTKIGVCTNEIESVQLCDNTKQIQINEVSSMMTLPTITATTMTAPINDMQKNDNDKHLNNNCAKIIESSANDSNNDIVNENNSDYMSMFKSDKEMNNCNSMPSVNKQNKSLSEISICDKIQANMSTTPESSSLPFHLENVSNSISIQNVVNDQVSDITSMATTTASTSTTSLLSSTSSLHPVMTIKSTSQKIARDFIPSSLISTVSPYPHHIPIANILKSECNNGDSNEHSSQCHQLNADENCCNKQNTINKDAKETKAKKQNWSIKFNCTKLKGSPNTSSSTTATSTNDSNDSNVVANNSLNSANSSTASTPATLLLDKSALFSTSGGNVIVVTMDQRQPLLDFARFTPDDFAIDEDCDKKARLQRAIEIAEGVEPPPGFISTTNLQSLHSMATPNLQLQLPNSIATTATATTTTSNDANGNNTTNSKTSPPQWHMLCSNNPTLRFMLPNNINHLLQPTDEIPIPRIHSQVDYIHCLVPDLMQITNCSYYWGKMDRYEAERLLENKPEGTFLLRDSAQEEFLFSVSFRKYGRSLHARIEQFNHMFSFDCHDPGVYTSKTVTGLLEHYKDPACVMFFEPALTLPLNRNFVFSLQQLCRATIVSHTSYDGINEICLPKKLKSYLKEYHYKQRVKVRRFDESNYGAT